MKVAVAIITVCQVIVAAAVLKASFPKRFVKDWRHWGIRAALLNQRVRSRR